MALDSPTRQRQVIDELEELRIERRRNNNVTLGRSPRVFKLPSIKGGLCIILF